MTASSDVSRARVERASNAALDQLITSMAYTVNSRYGVFYQGEWEALECTAHAGFVAAPAPTPHPLLVAQLHADADAPLPSLLVVHDCAQDPRFATLQGGLFDIDSPIRSLIALPVVDAAGQMRGIAVLADDQPHAGPSPAQQYVLLTHVAQFVAQLDLEHLRAAPSDTVTRIHPDHTIERLRLLESVVVHAKDAILITEAEPIDLPGPRIVYCNGSFEQTTGYSEAEVLGKTPRILQSERTNRAALDRIRAALAAWQPIEVELLNVKKDGTEFWVELSIVPVCDETGWFTHWVSVQRDISERKLAEEIAARVRQAEAENIALSAQLVERKRIEAGLIYTASHDDLTALRNRPYFMDRLRIVLEQIHARGGPTSAVLFLDLDRFKLINDSLGHRAGDRLLIDVADRLQACIRPQDTLARLGGDEFVILLEDIDELHAAIALAERIEATLRLPFRIEGQDVFAMGSIGIVEVSVHYHKAEDVLRDADVAMYVAKGNHSGCYSVFTASMRTTAIEALALQTQLQKAVAEQELRLTYQPIHDPTTKAILGMEALIRWLHPVRGMVSPAEFIPIAEVIGVIREVGMWMRRESFCQMREWTARYPDADLTLSVNVSAVELLDYRFLDELRQLLDETGMPPRYLQIEITESVFLRQPEHVGKVLQSIRALGIRIALDDFGTGYSSLAYIDRYPIDAIKIDQSFVVRMLTQERTMAIVDSMLLLGRALGIRIIAEGVEDAAQLDALRRAGCAHVQGFFLNKPMSATLMDAALQAQAGAGSPGADAL